MDTAENLLKDARELNEQGGFYDVKELLPEKLLSTLNSADLYGELAFALKELGEFSKCDEILKIIFKIEPDQHRAVKINNRFSSDEVSYDRSINQGKNPRYINSYYELGRKYEKENKHTLAIDAYMEIINLVPSYIPPYRRLGDIFIKIGKIKKAKKLFKRVVNLADDSESHLALGRVYLLLKENDKAEKSLMKAIQLRNKSDATFYLADLYISQNNFDPAFKILDEAITIKNRPAHAYYLKGQCYQKLRKYNDSITPYLEAIKGFDILKTLSNDYNKSLAYSYNALGCAYLGLKDSKNAIIELNKSIIADPEYAGGYYNLSNTLYNIAIESEERRVDLLNEIYESSIKCSNIWNEEIHYYSYVSKLRNEEIYSYLQDLELYDLARLIKKIQYLLKFEDNYLTHFTSLSVAEKLVINESPLRISEGSFLNDTSEGYNLDNFLNFQKEVSDNIRNELMLKSFVAKRFVGSFVADKSHNDLTLWRMYGKENREEGQGCALTLKTDEILKFFSEIITADANNTVNQSMANNADIDTDVAFYRVAYKDRASDAFFVQSISNDDLKKFNEVMTELKLRVNVYIQNNKADLERINSLVKQLNSIKYLFKSSDYQHEQEIRLVVIGEKFEKKIDEMVRPFRVYIEGMKINSLIEKITLGPKVLRAEEWASAFYYKLDKQNLHPQIVISHLPFK
ncbi:tetratricopeptide repeat protein [Dyadobacter frigoris]|uniref:DUF2971 domain-containing protein n=1 Tax=Dyadobacter frigoris TaxID=2576211 RepID=A0A4V6Y1Z1_9BACT|nr:CDC27 family protein [Dyadobacter frigoris]TKT91903.1 DUF2971 domain-containing protein [Dyadobacter frigoris]GLU53227.1 hypothetical protein Dfri01_26880 [Dyadobacter frigoris]